MIMRWLLAATIVVAGVLMQQYSWRDLQHARKYKAKGAPLQRHAVVLHCFPNKLVQQTHTDSLAYMQHAYTIFNSFYITT